MAGLGWIWHWAGPVPVLLLLMPVAVSEAPAMQEQPSLPKPEHSLQPLSKKQTHARGDLCLPKYPGPRVLSVSACTGFMGMGFQPFYCTELWGNILEGKKKKIQTNLYKSKSKTAVNF